MKYFINLLILPLILSLWGGVSPAEGKVCFIIDPDGKCASGKVEKFQQDCSARGYTKTCNEMQDGVGGSCDGKYKKCKCKAEYNLTKAETAGHELAGDFCEDDQGKHYKYEVCKSEYRYVKSESGYINEIQGSTFKPYNRNVENCDSIAVSGETCLEQTAGRKIARYTKCECDKTKYPYTKADEKSGAIVVGGTTCTDSSGIHYTSLSCANGYTRGSCPDNDGWISSDVTESNDKTLTCVRCTAKTCASEGYDLQCRPAGVSSPMSMMPCSTAQCQTGYKPEVTDNLQLGSSTGSCYKCVAKTCKNLGYDLQCRPAGVSSPMSMMPCSAAQCQTGYKPEVTDNLQLGSSTGSCYKCVEKVERCEDYGLSSNLKSFYSATIEKTLSDGTVCFNIQNKCSVGDIMFDIKLNQAATRVNNVCATAEVYEDMVYTKKLGTLYSRQGYTKEEIISGVDRDPGHTGNYEEIGGFYVMSTLPVSFSLSGDTVTATSFNPSQITLVTRNEVDKAYIRIDGDLKKLSSYISYFNIYEDQELDHQEVTAFINSSKLGYGPLYFFMGGHGYSWPEDILRKINVINKSGRNCNFTINSGGLLISNFQTPSQWQKVNIELEYADMGNDEAPGGPFYKLSQYKKDGKMTQIPQSSVGHYSIGMTSASRDLINQKVFCTGCNYNNSAGGSNNCGLTLIFPKRYISFKE